MKSAYPVLLGLLAVTAHATGCSSPSPGAAHGEGSPPVSPTALEPARPALDAWQRQIAKVPTPHAGCFEAKLPGLTWNEVECGTAQGPATPPPDRLPRQGEGASASVPMKILPEGVGNGGVYGDWNATLSAGQYSSVLLSFPGVIGNTQPAPFTIQLNTNPWTP